MNHRPFTSNRRLEGSRTRIGTVAAPAILALTLGFSLPARADMSVTNPDPSFTPAEVELIARNDSLRSALKTEPWLVLRAVKLLDQPHVGRDLPIGDGERRPTARPNPDMGRFQRIAPEAAQDLFALLKKAGEKNIPK